MTRAQADAGAATNGETHQLQQVRPWAAIPHGDCRSRRQYTIVWPDPPPGRQRHRTHGGVGATAGVARDIREQRPQP